MLTTAARGRFTVVLVGARNPQNIGSVARAMHDFGFTHLRVVNQFPVPFEAARMEATSAVNAGSVMQSARLFTSLREAVEDCTLVAGTTAVGERGLRQNVLPLQKAASSLLNAMAKAVGELSGDEAASRAEAGKVALLFGSEKTGLTKQELSFCSVLLTIPMFEPEGRHLSMNLGQAVAVCLYELTRAGFEGSRALPVTEPASATTQDRDRVLSLVLETMDRSGYSRRFPANARVEVVRQLVLQLGATRDETATWMGLFRQLLRALPDAPSRPTKTADL